MRLPLLRFRLRTLLLLVALVALALVGHGIYRDGPETRWLLLKLRYGSVEARRSAAIRAWHSESEAMFHDLVDSLFGPSDTRTSEAHWGRRAELLLPALARAAAKDPDASCRAEALRALHALATLHASGAEKLQALRQILAAARDEDDSVRAAAVGSLVGLADRDTGAILNTIRAAVADPSVEVRRAATRELGMIGTACPATQPDVASILIPLLGSREDPRVRIRAAWGMAYFGVDRRRHPPGSGPDVVPALVAALRDPDVEVRRTAAVILGNTTTDARLRTVSSWDLRKGAIIPALDRAISDDDRAVREEAALALFSLGRRDPAIIELMEQAVRDPDRSEKFGFESALKAWQEEREEGAPVEPETSGDGTPPQPSRAPMSSAGPG